MKDVVTFADWEKLDVRLGTILEASAPEWSNKLIELHVDFGSEVGERTIFTGMRKWYEPTHFSGKQALFLVNLAPRKMGPGESQGMLLSLDTLDADGNSHPHVVLFDSAFPLVRRYHKKALCQKKLHKHPKTLVVACNLSSVSILSAP